MISKSIRKYIKTEEFFSFFNVDLCTAMHKDTGQSSMMRFLTCNKTTQQNQDITRNNILTQSRTQMNNLHTAIRPNDVKLLSDDSAGIDFLTLCALKKSEEEMSPAITRQMDVTYIPAPKAVADLFSFVVPDIKVIDNLLFLTRLQNDSQTRRKSCENHLPAAPCRNKDNETNNDCITINDNDDGDNNFWCSIRDDEHVNKKEVNFEDILDASSTSTEASLSPLSQGITNLEIDSINEIPTVNAESNKGTTDERTEVPIDNIELMMDDMGPSIFENILDESFSSTEDGLEDETTAQPREASPNSSSALDAVDTGKVNEGVVDDNLVNIYRDEDNVNEPDRSMSGLGERTESNRANKSTSSLIVDGMEELDFSSDDDINGFIKCEFEKNRSMCNSDVERSLLSITQAIGEIARMKRDPKPLAEAKENPRKDPKEYPEGESIDNTGWISVNTKCETKAEKRNSPATGIGRLSLVNVARESTTKSCGVDRENNFPNDSDEDFMLTEDSARKFDELESCYFHVTSKNAIDDNIRLPGTSRSTEIKRSIDNAKTSRAENSRYHSGDITRGLRPCGMSTPNTKGRRPELSLNRKRGQHPSMMDLSLFEAPNRCALKARDKNVTGYNADVEPLRKASALQAGSVAGKIRHRSGHGNIARNEFIDDEAEVDFDVSSDESVVTDDEDIADFVNDMPHSQDRGIDMHAHYLQTIKSPAKRPGAFHFRKPRSLGLNEEVYSQPLSQAQDTYLYVREV